MFTSAINTKTLTLKCSELLAKNKTLKNNVPRYLVIDFSKADESAIASNDDILAISKRLMAQNKEAYEVLAK